MEIKITDVKIFNAKKRGPVLAYANVVLNNSFIIRGITLLETKKGRFVSMPSRRLNTEDKPRYRDLCHPLNSKVREAITKAIFAAYDEQINETDE